MSKTQSVSVRNRWVQLRIREVFGVNKIIRDITYPVRIFPLVGYALDHGGITCVQANTVMGYVPHSPKAAHYFDFGCQVGVLYEEDSSQLGEIVYLPTQFGRTLYLCWQEDHRKALAQLMGSIPQYRFHTELLLAELILSETVRSASFAGDLSRLVATPGLHWYFAGRMRWIQDSIGWRDASSFRVDQLSILSKRILALMRTGRRYYEKVWAKWDNALGFGTRPWRSRLTRMERLCEFLQATRQQPLRVVGESLDDETLVALVLLMVAKEQCYALTATHCADAIGKLLGLGVDVRQDDGTAYLFSAVDLIIRDAQMLAQSPLGDPGLAGVNSLLNNFLGSRLLPIPRPSLSSSGSCSNTYEPKCWTMVFLYLHHWQMRMMSLRSRASNSGSLLACLVMATMTSLMN
jgi:hypothetical protein